MERGGAIYEQESEELHCTCCNVFPDYDGDGALLRCLCTAVPSVFDMPAYWIWIPVKDLFLSPHSVEG